jgi:hypothetical protein
VADVYVFGGSEQGEVPALRKAAEVVQRLTMFGIIQFCPVALSEHDEPFRIVAYHARSVVGGATCLHHSSRSTSTVARPRGHRRSTSTRLPSPQARPS